MSAESFKSIRSRLGLTQSAIADVLGVTQGNISFYEKGQTVPPAVAGKLIEYAKSRGHLITYDDIYRAPPELIGMEGAPAVPQKAVA